MGDAAAFVRTQVLVAQPPGEAAYPTTKIAIILIFIIYNIFSISLNIVFKFGGKI